MREASKHICYFICLSLAPTVLMRGLTLPGHSWGQLVSAHAALPMVADPSWVVTGNLNTARPGHSATLLPNGKVLVVGGDVGGCPADGAIASAELYDPSTGTWSFTGSLNVPRVSHTATLLGNGKVLVAGGFGHRRCQYSDLTNTAELYDPATGEWSFTGNLNVLRIDHTATLLPNGKVLFAGSGPTAELYDPTTGKWNSTGNLNETRVYHQATLLQDGKVLVAAGCEDPECFSYVDRAEVYDPTTGTWRPTGGLNAPRENKALTTLPNGNVLLPAGNFFTLTLNTAELYDPATERWSYTGSLLNPRSQETITLLSIGQVLVVGGSIGNLPGAVISNSAELYDPATGKWNITAPLNTSRYSHTATLLSDGKVLIVGGFDDDHFALRSAELYSNTGAGTVVTVSGASYRPLELTSEAIAAAFGPGLATTTDAATTLPLPTQLAGTTVKVKDAAGTERLAPLFFVSPTQVNYQIPAETATGAATISITNSSSTVSTGVALIRAVAPSLFAANGDGQGVAAALVLRVRANGSQGYEPVAQFDTAQNRFIARPLDLGPEGDQVYLILFGTGLRGRGSLGSVIASIGGTYGEVSYAGAQGDFAGLDQVNVLVPTSLTGRGEVDVLLTVEAQMANPVRIQLK